MRTTKDLLPRAMAVLHKRGPQPAQSHLHQPGISQPKMATTSQIKSQPVAPPAYHPQPMPRGSQTRIASDRRSQIDQSAHQPVAPPVYRPEPKRIVQPKRAATMLAPGPLKAPPAYRPQSVPKVMQAQKRAAPAPSIAARNPALPVPQKPPPRHPAPPQANNRQPQTRPVPVAPLQMKEQVVQRQRAPWSGVASQPSGLGRVIQRAPKYGWDAKKLDEEKEEKKKAVEQVKKEAKQKAEELGKKAVEEWKQYLLSISDQPDHDRAWPDKKPDPHPHKLRILAFQRGEQYIHAAAMLLEPKATVEIVYDTETKLDLYRQEGAKEGASGSAAIERTYKRLHPSQTPPPLEAIQIDLATQSLNSALAIRQYLINSGICHTRIKLIGVKTTRLLKDQNPNRATNIVNNAMRKSIALARTVISQGLPKSKDAESRVLETIEACKITKGGKYVLLWIRATGRSPGGAPEYDTREIFARQIIAMIAERFKDRKLLLIGDELFTKSNTSPQEQHLLKENQPLVGYWNLKKLNYNEQVLFLKTLDEYADCISVGIESGVLELPFLLGMPTIYLEPAKVREKKGNRWRDFWSTTDRNKQPQERATYTSARLLYVTDTEIAALVLTTWQRFERWIQSLKPPAKMGKLREQAAFKNLLGELLRYGDSEKEIERKWENVSGYLAKAMAEIKVLLFNEKELGEIRKLACEELAKFQLTKTELNRLEAQVSVLRLRSSADRPRPRFNDDPSPAPTFRSRGRANSWSPGMVTTLEPPKSKSPSVPKPSAPKTVSPPTLPPKTVIVAPPKGESITPPKESSSIKLPQQQQQQQQQAPPPVVIVQQPLPVTGQVIERYVLWNTTGTIIDHIQRAYRQEQLQAVNHRGIDLTINPSINPPQPHPKSAWNTQAAALLGELNQKFGIPKGSGLEHYLQMEARNVAFANKYK